MKNDIKLETIYVDIDALLDTRLGTIHKHDSELATKIITSGKYHTRDCDEFDGLDKDKFRELYNNRDNEVLKCSVVTNVIVLLKQLVFNFNQQAITKPFHSGCKLCINLYPYSLSDEETSLIRDSVECAISQLIEINFINLSPVMLNPRYCKESFALMIKYDYEDWLNQNAKAFESCILPEVMLYAPAIYFNKKPTENELSEIMRKSKHPLIAIEVLTSPIICLRLLDVELFSIIKK